MRIARMRISCTFVTHTEPVIISLLVMENSPDANENFAYVRQAPL